jgi:hypothetical protein
MMDETLQRWQQGHHRSASHRSTKKTTTECNEQKVDALITQDGRVKVRHIVAQPDIGHNAVQDMINALGYRKVGFIAFPDC